MVLVERDAAHQHSLDLQIVQQKSKMLDCKTSLAARGQWIGLALTIFLSGAGVLLGLKGHDWLAGTICTTTIVAVVTIFVLQRKIGDPDDEDDDGGQGGGNKRSPTVGETHAGARSARAD